MSQPKKVFGRWVAQRRTEMGLTLEAVAAAVGVSKQQISNYEKGSVPKTEKLGRLAEVLKVDRAEALRLLDTVDEPASALPEQRFVPDPPAKPPPHPDLVYVPLSVIAQAGEGQVPFSIAVEEYLTYQRDQLRRELGGLNPDRLHMITVSGNSMYPTLAAGDRILVAEYGNEPIMDSTIYVWMHAWNGVVVKRVRWMKNGSLKLESDNRMDPRDFTIKKGEDHDWKCVGRVIRVEKTL